MNEANFGHLLNTAPVMIWLSGTDSGLSFVSQAWLDFSGTKQKEELGDGWMQRIHQADFQEVVGIYQEAFKYKKKFSMEYRVKSARGEYRWILNSGVPHYDEKGAFLGYIGACIDITDRKKAEEALLRNQKYFQTMIENSQDIITVLSKNGTIRYESASIETILGYKPEELIGRNAFEFVHPMDLLKMKKIFDDKAQLPGATDSMEYRFRHKNGEWRVLEGIGQVALDDSDQVIAVVNSRDVTQRHSSEEAIKQSEARFRAMADSSPLGIFVTDRNGDFIYANRIYQAIAGVDEKDCAGKGWNKTLHPHDRDRVLGLWYNAVKEKSAYSSIHRFLREDGSIVWTNVKAAVFQDGGNLLGYVGTVEDITERVSKEEEMKHQARELARSIADLERFNRLAVGRELRMIELKREVNDLCEKLGRKPRYNLSFTDEWVKFPKEGEK